MRILYGGSVKPDNARTLMARRRRQRRPGRRSEPQSRRLSCHHRRVRLDRGAGKGLVPSRLAYPPPHGRWPQLDDAQWHQPRHCRSAAAGARRRALRSSTRTAAPSSRPSRPSSSRAGHAAAWARARSGPRSTWPPRSSSRSAASSSWTSNCCSAAGAGHSCVIPHDPDPAAREVESKDGAAKGPPAKAAKAPDAEKKQAVPLKKAAAPPADQPAKGAAKETPPAKTAPQPEAASAPAKEGEDKKAAVPPVDQPAKEAARATPDAAPAAAKEGEDKKSAAPPADQPPVKEAAKEAPPLDRRPRNRKLARRLPRKPRTRRPLPSKPPRPRRRRRPTMPIVLRSPTGYQSLRCSGRAAGQEVTRARSPLAICAQPV